MVLLFVAFAAGIVVGVAGLTTSFRAGKADFIWRGMGGGGRGMMGGGGPSGGMGAWVAKELDVQAEKRDSIIAIYKRGSAAVDSIVHGNIRAPMDSLWESIRPAVEARRLQTRADVRALLTPQQQVRYDSMTQASDANRKQMRDQSRGGPRGPR
jgi:Spy/CpxP family protein refolding chaperone